jgi:uncharacterized membrane protein YedE/YeeE
MRIAPVGKLLLGLGTGVVFGSLLSRGRVSRYEVIMDQLLLRDATVAKIMGTAIAVGAVGVHALVRAGKTRLEIKPLQLGGVIGGGLAFGAGLALLGYCPGTSLAAVGEGKRDALTGTLGMLAGALAFVRAYPTIKPLLEAGDHGKLTLVPPDRSPWPAVVGVASAVSAAFAADQVKRLQAG